MDPCRERAYICMPGLGYREIPGRMQHHKYESVLYEASAASIWDNMKLKRKWRKDTWLVLQV